MNRGFYTIMAAQFFSSLADNALLISAIALLREIDAPGWMTPMLKLFFVVSYVALAAFVGAFADSFPKGRVMFITNMIKIGGCLLMLFSVHPLFAYAVVGFGAAAYSPAKYGILTELLPPERLVVANSWMEGTTVAAIVLGAIIGGALINPQLAESILSSTGLASVVIAPKFAIVAITSLYLAAALINLLIPRLPIDHKLPSRSPLYVLHDFWHSFKLLWRDPLGQVSLAVTTLFWGVGATLRLLIITWAALNLKYGLDQATQLTAASAFGIAIGSVLAGKFVRLQGAIGVLPAGIILGFVPIALIWVNSLVPALLLLLLAGILAGYFVVPMNALLQHRGHLLMGAGHSIAQQNFNENISILMLTGAYALMMRAEWHIHTIVLVFGLFISTVMTAIWLRHRNDVVH
jgi:MFS family permease